MAVRTLTDLLADQVQLCEGLVQLGQEKQRRLVQGDHQSLNSILQAETEHLEHELALEEERQTLEGFDSDTDRLDLWKDLAFRLRRALFQLDLLNRQNELLIEKGSEMTRTTLQILEGGANRDKTYSSAGRRRSSFPRAGNVLAVNHRA
ncbi:MAG: flagellar export chaperone FlgN [Armatimonadetes bacterium]|nr:flagellar export chaperone FlgN [Armatimonadota bacterium]